MLPALEDALDRCIKVRLMLRQMCSQTQRIDIDAAGARLEWRFARVSDKDHG